MLMLSCAHLKNVFKKAFRNTIRVSNGLDPDQNRRVGHDLGQKCLQRLSEEDKIRRMLGHFSPRAQF